MLWGEILHGKTHRQEVCVGVRGGEEVTGWLVYEGWVVGPAVSVELYSMGNHVCQ